MDQIDDFEKAVLFSFDQSGAVDDNLKVGAVDPMRKLGQHGAFDHIVAVHWRTLALSPNSLPAFHTQMQLDTPCGHLSALSECKSSELHAAK